MSGGEIALVTVSGVVVLAGSILFFLRERRPTGSPGEEGQGR